MARQLPSLNALRAFEAAARHVSLTLAASEMNVSHAAVSRHIRELEAWLGVELFIRTGRGVELSAAGRTLANDLTLSFDRLADAVEPYAPKQRRGQLVITSDIAFAACWLAPRLGQFSAKHADFEIVLDPSSRLVDFTRNEADLGIRCGGGGWENVEARKLAPALVSPVCSPAFLKANKIRQPDDLLRVPLLHEDPKQHWQNWFAIAGLKAGVPTGGRLVLGHLQLLVTL